jgi:hypothetical protein
MGREDSLSVEYDGWCDDRWLVVGRRREGDAIGAFAMLWRLGVCGGVPFDGPPAAAEFRTSVLRLFLVVVLVVVLLLLLLLLPAATAFPALPVVTSSCALTLAPRR